MGTDDRTATVYVTPDMLRGWMNCYENLHRYASGESNLLIDTVNDCSSGQKIKIVLIKA